MNERHYEAPVPTEGEERAEHLLDCDQLQAVRAELQARWTSLLDEHRRLLDQSPGDYDRLRELHRSLAVTAKDLWDVDARLIDFRAGGGTSHSGL